MADELPVICWQIDLPISAGRVIGIAPYHGKTLIACERSVYEYEENFYTASGHLRIVDGALWEDATKPPAGAMVIPGRLWVTLTGARP